MGAVAPDCLTEEKEHLAKSIKSFKLTYKSQSTFLR